MKHFIWIFLALYTTVAVVACGKSGDDTAAAPAVQVGCPAGTVFSNGYCLNQYGQVVNTGSTAFKADNFRQGGVTISNSNVFRRFLSESMAVCDRGGTTYGTANCSSFLSGGYVQLTLQNTTTASNTARLTVEVWPGSSMTGGWYSATLPTGSQAATCGITMLLFGGCYMVPTANQMQWGSPVKAMDMVISDINNSAGIEGRAYGSVSTISQTKLIQLQVPNGHLTDGYLDFSLSYDGTSGGSFLTGRLLRCSDASCGFTYTY